MGDKNLVNALLSQGANSRATGNIIYCIWFSFIGFEKEGSVLHSACNLLDIEMVATAIKYCERDLDYLSPSGYAPIHILAMKVY